MSKANPKPQLARVICNRTVYGCAPGDTIEVLAPDAPADAVGIPAHRVAALLGSHIELVAAAGGGSE